MKNGTIKNLTLSAMLLAIGLVLPTLTGQIQQIGNMLLPMHIPVFLCALICGWKYGLAVGAILPLLRSVMFGMPVLFPTAIAMCFELATYGFVAGFLYGKSRWQCVAALYQSMLLAMITGRIIWGFMQILLLGMSGNAFTWQMFMAGAFLNALPGIARQLVLVPSVMVALNRTRLVRFRQEKQTHSATAIGG